MIGMLDIYLVRSLFSSLPHYWNLHLFVLHLPAVNYIVHILNIELKLAINKTEVASQRSIYAPRTLPKCCFCFCNFTYRFPQNTVEGLQDIVTLFWKDI